MLNNQSASVWRRLMAGVYDLFVLFALVMMTGFFYVAVYKKITGSLEAAAHPLLLQLTLFPLIVFIYWGFYAWCWMRGGRTLGMQAWRIRLVSMTNQPITLKQCAQRSFLAILSLACLGLGYWSALWHPEKLTWHDRFSRTKVIREEKK